MLMKPKILVINGSLGGSSGNSARLLQEIRSRMRTKAQLDVLTLANQPIPMRTLQKKLGQADGYLFLTGTYWDSWGSPMQKFLESVTPWEGTPLWLGKPAACVILMHSVGGKEVLSRLQGVLVTMGCSIPPMSGMAYSLAGEIAAQNESAHGDDFWRIGDLDIVLENLLEGVSASCDALYRSWVVDRKDPSRIWLKKSSR